MDVGEEGEHNFEFVEGEPLTDTGLSNIAFVEGTGLGGVGWDAYYWWDEDEYGSEEPDTSGFELEVGSDPLFRAEHDGSQYGSDEAHLFGIVRRREAIDFETDFRITFHDVDASQNNPENNRSVGVTDATEEERPFDNNDVSAIYFSAQEEDTDEPEVLQVGAKDGSGDSLDEEELDAIDFPCDLSIEYDGNEARFYRNGELLETLDAPSGRDWVPCISLEDDNDVTASGFIEVNDVEVEEI